jgi:hypothetical protein
VQALSQDSLNDVFSNSSALAAAAATTLGPAFALTDPLGAIAISAYIISSWLETGREQVDLITGREADSEELTEIVGAAERLSQEAMIGQISAHHIGPKLLVDVALRFDPATPLSRAHAVGRALARRVEKLESVARCQVQLRPDDEPVAGGEVASGPSPPKKAAVRIDIPLDDEQPSPADEEPGHPSARSPNSGSATQTASAAPPVAKVQPRAAEAEVVSEWGSESEPDDPITAAPAPAKASVRRAAAML